MPYVSSLQFMKAQRQLLVINLLQS